MTNYARVTGGLEEVKACVDTVVHGLLTVHPVLNFKVGIKARFNVLEDRLPAAGSFD
jgi:hypothetical protein